MPNINFVTSRERALCLIAITTVYALGLIAFLSAHDTITKPAKPLVAVGIDLGPPLPKPADRTSPPHPVPVKITLIQPAQPTPVAPSPETDQSATAPAGCDPAQRVGDAIRGDPQLLQSLAEVPDDLHTPAGVIAMWNEVWNPATADPGGPLVPLRSGITTVLGQLPPECLGQDVPGPRFVQIAIAQTNYVLVFGSNVWRWESLVAPPTDLATGQRVTTPQPPSSRPSTPPSAVAILGEAKRFEVPAND
ncbi:MAG: hypothetical protein ABIO85_06240 [Sphingomicrobium sp.]